LSDEERFWGEIKALDGQAWGANVSFQGAAVSEWVSRAPGQYWEPGARTLRKLVPAATELIDERWRAFHPFAKSSKVAGGIGTMKLAPAPDGYRLCTLAPGLNASSGVPGLISPDVWDALNLREGTLIDGKARWQCMTENWSGRFAAAGRAPGWLILDDPATLRHSISSSPTDCAPVKIHPFTIMEYHGESALFYDYVYAAASTGETGYRRELEDFFEAYRHANGRDGSYLLGADVNDPMWDARYRSPEALRSAERAGGACLHLLEARVKELAQGRETLSALVEALASVPNPTDLRKISADAGIPHGRWVSGGGLAEDSARLVSKAVSAGKVQDLVDAFVDSFPGAL
jgi:hypothetical protein